MADKKLNEVTKVTDMAYVPVIMSDGSIGQIAKADLASVVAGILGFPMVLKGELKFDANDISTNGIWACEGLSSNLPAGNGILINFETGRTVFKSMQLFADSTMKTLSLRINRGGSWDVWKSIPLV